jgi:methionyl-tRNA synthetase
MPDTRKKFYLTTPIYYVNARPHIGHAYSTIAADVIARRHRLLGDDTFFLTGTDEHGQKVQRSAEKAGIPPQQFADEVSATFQNLWKRMGITNDDYIRTTDERHKNGVQKLWRDLEARGAIYLSSYTGQYCVSEETFVEGPPGTIGPDGKPTETVTEENYFFRLSDYQKKLINLIESGTLQIQPETARNEVLSFLRGGIRDLSISRTSFTWGIPVPGNETHVVYVWLDALANYMTAVGYGSDSPADIAKFERYWPADLHLVGKEITRFHCVYWPAFLMGLRPPEVDEAEWNAKWLPKSVVANGWLLFEESKMSKSRGNVVRTETILDAFGPLCPPVLGSTPSTEAQPTEESALLKGTASAMPQTGSEDATLAAEVPPSPEPTQTPTKAQQDLFASDVIRYFLLREIPFGQDGSFSFDALITRYNADLANGYGNLVSRTLAMIHKYFDGQVGASGTAVQMEFFPIGENLLADKNLSFDPENITHTVRSILSYVAALDGFITEKSPWKLAAKPDAESQKDLDFMLYQTAETIRIITALFYPIMPYASASVWAQLGLGSIEEAARKGELKDLKWGGLKPGTKLGPLSPIFPRADKGLAQIMTEMESPTTPAAVNEKLVSSVTAEVSLLTGEPAAPTISEATPTITIGDFVKIDLRVAQIVVAERIPKADKLLRLEVDLGPDFTPSRRQILSGIAEWYTPEELIGKRIAVIANLAPRKMRGLESHGMLLAASGEDHSSKPILATFSDEIALGSKIR